jgi:hypothetical protein
MRPIIVPEHTRETHGQDSVDQVKKNVDGFLNQMMSFDAFENKAGWALDGHTVVESLEALLLNVFAKEQEYPHVVQDDPPDIELEQCIPQKLI